MDRDLTYAAGRLLADLPTGANQYDDADMQPPPRSLSLNPSEKLTVLRELDRFRNWISLDDQRHCLHCGRLITGRQIELIGDARDLGLVEARCPTKGCASIPLDWAMPANGA